MHTNVYVYMYNGAMCLYSNIYILIWLYSNVYIVIWLYSNVYIVLTQEKLDFSMNKNISFHQLDYWSHLERNDYKTSLHQQESKHYQNTMYNVLCSSSALHEPCPTAKRSWYCKFHDNAVTAILWALSYRNLHSGNKVPVPSLYSSAGSS